MRKAWLITWEGTPHALGQRERVVAVFDSRLSGKRIRPYVELFYANSEYSLVERLLYAKKKFNPYPARFKTIEGIPWQGEVICDSNPWLCARWVKNLKVKLDGNGTEEFSWQEMVLEQIKRMKELHKDFFFALRKYFIVTELSLIL